MLTAWVEFLKDPESNGLEGSNLSMKKLKKQKMNFID
ncbi:hypothetical protein BCD72_001594 [Clostridium butyricum]|nr:hypothetical protein [Clostridium butyricum]MBA8971073.1 hypothetical protein [Clostridium butyricum]NOW37059.1 hypothetical protein [Clostridium butyricum]